MTIGSHTAHERTDQPTDAQLQRDVREELEWTPEVDASAITVSAHHGVVHLEGEVRDAEEDARARKAALRVRGVLGIVDSLRPAPPRPVDDDVLLDNVEHALRHAAEVPEGVRASVHEGLVTLTGSTTWHAEREAARRVVERLTGVRGVRNDIALTDRPSAADTERRIRQALLRNAAVDADAIDVRIDGTEAVLEGAVRSFAERQQAEQVAWSSPHVTQVHNRIVVVA